MISAGIKTVLQVRRLPGVMAFSVRTPRATASPLAGGHTRSFRTFAACALCVAMVKSSAFAQFVLPAISGRQLITNGQPFTLKSVAYSPTPIGSDPSASITSATMDPRLMQRDGPVLASLGANSVRIYGAMVMQMDGSFAFGVTREWLQEAADQGLWVLMGTFIPPQMDFSDATVRQDVIDAHLAMVNEFGAEPNVLMWVPGNEVNATTSNVDAYYTLMDAVAINIRSLQGGGTGPDFGPYVSVVDGDSGAGIAGKASLAPNVDIWAGNLFRGSHLGALFTTVAANTAKPFWIAEFGIDSWDNIGNIEDQISQADFLQTLWWQVETANSVTFGGNIGFFVDEFWKSGSPSTHSFGGTSFGGAPDNFMNEEWLGISTPFQVSGQIDDLTLKDAYWRAREVWVNGLIEPAPLRVTYDTHFNTNYGGLTFGIYGRGDPFVSDFGQVSLSLLQPGSSGQPADKALQAAGSLQAGTTFTFFGIVIPLTTTVGQGFDFTGYSGLSFDIRRGSATAHSPWFVRLEDGAPTGAGDFNNKNIALPALTTSFQSIQIPLSDFTSGGGQVVDLSLLSQVVFAADTSGPAPPSFELDLIIDNVRITKSAPAPIPPVISPIANASVDDAELYSVTPVLTQGSGPVIWTLVAPVSPPSGMSINPDTGRLTWVADINEDPVDLTIQATGPGGTDQASWTLAVSQFPPLAAAGKTSALCLFVLVAFWGATRLTNISIRKE